MLTLLDATSYLPKFLKSSPIMIEVMDCLNVLISKETPIFSEIESAYNDTLYRAKDYSKLSYNAKVEVIRELGFGYLLDILTLTSEQLTQLLIFFNLIYILKGKREGLEICLNTMGLIYTYESWEEMEPRGQRFTAKLNIVGNSYANPEIFKKIKNFIRSYMLPLVEITIELTIDAPPALAYPSAGLLERIENLTLYSTTRDLLEVAVYDFETSIYDKSLYAPGINSGPNQYVSATMPFYNLTIMPTPSSAIVEIDGRVTNVAQVEQGKLISYKVYDADNIYVKKEGMIVVNADKELRVKLRLK